MQKQDDKKPRTLVTLIPQVLTNRGRLDALLDMLSEEELDDIFSIITGGYGATLEDVKKQIVGLRYTLYRGRND